MTKSYLATQFWVYMYDKSQFYLFSKIIKKSNTILVAIESYKQKTTGFPMAYLLLFQKLLVS
jgi:hypothetical protein